MTAFFFHTNTIISVWNEEDSVPTVKMEQWEDQSKIELTKFNVAHHGRFIWCRLQIPVPSHVSA